MAPTASAQTAAAPSSQARSSDGHARPSSPSSASAGSRTASNTRSTANSDRPPAVRAVTSRCVASGAPTAMIWRRRVASGPIPACRGRGVLPVVAEGRLGGGKGDDRLPGDDVSSRPVATSPPARRSRPAATADPADVLGQGGAEEAAFIGERAPDVGLPTRSRLGGPPALSGPGRTSSSPRGHAWSISCCPCNQILAVVDRGHRQRRQIGPGLRFGIALAEEHLRGQDSGEAVILLLRCAIGDDCVRDHPDAHGRQRRGARQSRLSAERMVLREAPAAATVLDRPSRCRVRAESPATAGMRAPHRERRCRRPTTKSP